MIFEVLWPLKTQDGCVGQQRGGQEGEGLASRMRNNTSTPGMEELESVGADVHLLDYGFCFLCEEIVSWR